MTTGRLEKFKIHSSGQLIAPHKPMFHVDAGVVVIAKMTHVVLLGPAGVGVSLGETMGVLPPILGDFALV